VNFEPNTNESYDLIEEESKTSPQQQREESPESEGSPPFPFKKHFLHKHDKTCPKDNEVRFDES
jgi:hypothetical protein